MRKLKFTSIFLLIFLVGMLNVRAECSMDESSKLSSLAVNVKVDYEIVEKEMPMEEGFNYPDGLTEEEIANYKNTSDFFRIHIYNITEELYVEVRNTTTGDSKNYYYADTDNGTVSFDEIVSEKITDYTVTVYSSNKTGCSDKKLTTITKTTPMYNVISELAICDGIEEYYLCQPYLSVKTNFENYESLIKDYRKNKEGKSEASKKEEKKEGFLGFLKNNKGIVVATVVLIVTIGGLVTVIIVKRQRSRVI